MAEEFTKVTLKDVARELGTEEGELSSECLELFERKALHYRTLEGADREEVLISVIKTLYSSELSIVGQERKVTWERGWAENLQEFIQRGYNVDALAPKYFHPERPLRFKRQYIKSKEPHFEWHFAKLLRTFLFQKYFYSVDSIFEFGCGTGSNLIELSNLFPKKDLVGLDWTTSSQEILSQLNERVNSKITGKHFDYFSPDESLTLPPNSGVLTSASLEQIGPAYEVFLDFIMRRKPSVVLHIEPIVEFYDEHILIDYLAAEYHRKRRYLQGYWPELKRLEGSGIIIILAAHRPLFGSLYNEGYSYIIWRPLK